MRLVKILVSLGLLQASFLVVAPVAAGDPCYHGFDMPARAEGTDPQIKLMDCAFAPTVTRVAPGTTVTFFNGPVFTHLITGANLEWGSRDREVQPGQKVSYRFDKPGIYPFACALHRGMSGAIVVGDVAAAAAAPAAPAGDQAKAVADTTSTSTGGSPAPVAATASLGQLAAIGAGGMAVGVCLGFAFLRWRSGRRLPPVLGHTVQPD